jgi:5-hydroxyisourate hydrolase-like protein (transthyretin family)
MNKSIRQVGGAILAATVGLSSLAALSSPAQAAAPGRIAGVVEAAGGGPVAGIHVAAIQWQSDISQWVEVDSDDTDATGRYMVGKLPPGTYRVRFYDPTGAYATEFYNDKAVAEDADPIGVTEGKEELASADLGGAAHVVGKVTGSDGAGIPAAEVTAYVKQDGAWIEFQSVVAGADGTYDLGGLPGGEYTLGFHDPASGVTEYWNNQATLAEAHSLTVMNAGRSDGIDASLATPMPQPEPEPQPTPTPAVTPVTTTVTPTAAPTAPAAAPTATTVRTVAVVKMPKIKGFTKVGQRLRVTKGAWNPTTAKRKLQWLANGKKIKGATKTRLRLTKKLAGKKISVKVVARASGMTSLTVKTKATKKVKR